MIDGQRCCLAELFLGMAADAPKSDGAGGVDDNRGLVDRELLTVDGGGAVQVAVEAVKLAGGCDIACAADGNGHAAADLAQRHLTRAADIHVWVCRVIDDRFTTAADRDGGVVLRTVQMDVAAAGDGGGQRLGAAAAQLAAAADADGGMREGRLTLHLAAAGDMRVQLAARGDRQPYDDLSSFGIAAAVGRDFQRQRLVLVCIRK